MLVPSHVALPVAIMYVANRAPVWQYDKGSVWISLSALVVGFFGMLPDIIGKLAPAYVWKWKFMHRAYNKMHRPWLWLKGWKWWLAVGIYFALTLLAWWLFGFVGLMCSVAYLLHLATDYPIHTDEDGMRNWPLAVTMEVICYAWIVYVKVAL